MKFMANFKCNHTPSSIKAYFDIFNAYAFDAGFFDKHEIVFFPPFLSLGAALDFAKVGKIGAQNAYPAQKGAFTGEVGIEALESSGVGIVLVGHSERRALGESQKLLARKCEVFAQAGFSVVYCVGENLAVRKSGMRAVEAHLREQFAGIDSSLPNLTIAYEPIWAIGSGVSASAQEIEQTHAFLRSLTSAPLLYGGSVNAKNAREILSVKNVDGLLVGSAALTPQGFYDIIQEGVKAEGIKAEGAKAQK